MPHDDPLYGSVALPEVAQAVLENPALERLRGVHQNGAAYLVNPAMDTDRFEHSVGVAVLCQRFGADEREVLAALVHDIGHTAFSHVADHVFDRQDQAFHEDHAAWVAGKHGLTGRLEELGYPLEELLATDAYSLLEQDLPALCADRLDYQLRDVFKYGLIDREDVLTILAGLTVEAGRIVAQDRQTARRLVDVSLLLQRQVFYDPLHEAANLLVERSLAEALARELLEVEDLFLTDEEVLDRLTEAPDLAWRVSAIGPDLEVERRGPDAVYRITRKRRTMDPLVAGTGARISEIDPRVARRIETFDAHVPDRQGYAISLP